MIVHHQTGNNCRNTHRLTRSGSACNEQMRHARQISHQGLTRNILPQGNRQRGLQFLEFRAFHERTQAYGGVFRVGNLNTHIRTPRHWRFNPQSLRRERQRQITLQCRNLRHPHLLLHHLTVGAGTLNISRFNGKLGDGGAHPVAHDPHRQTKLGQCLLNLLPRLQNNRLIRYSRQFFQEQCERRQAGVTLRRAGKGFFLGFFGLGFHRGRGFRSGLRWLLP